MAWPCVHSVVEERMVILALDYGEKRIGVAVSDPLGAAAHGLPTIVADESGSEMDRIAAVVAERKAELILVGLPMNMDGTEGPQARKARGFVKRLGRRVHGVAIEMVDERLTSVQAHRELSREGAGMRERAERVDRMAAQLILTKYLNRRRPDAGADDAQNP